MKGSTNRHDIDPLTRRIADALVPQVRERIPACAAGCSIAPLLEVGPVIADASSKIVVQGASGKPAAVLFCSNRNAPDLVARAVARAKQASEILRWQAGEVILNPVLEGIDHDVTYALYDWCEPLSKNRVRRAIQKRWLAPWLFGWLRDVQRSTVRDATPEEIDQLFAAPLLAMADASDLDDRVHQFAEVAALRLVRGIWRPRVVLAHNDLWQGNVLLRDDRLLSLWRGRSRFAVIDWAGASASGHPFYDLVRLADSFNLSGNAWEREVLEHCRLVDCDPVDARGHLLAGLGVLAANRGCLSRERYVRLVHSCCHKMFPVVATRQTHELESLHAPIG